MYVIARGKIYILTRVCSSMTTAEKIRDTLVTIMVSAMFIGILFLMLGCVFDSDFLKYIGFLFWVATFILMFIAQGAGEYIHPSGSYVYEDIPYSEPVHRECRACTGTGQCRLCRGTGQTGWSGTRAMSKSRCPICLGTGICAKCRGTSTEGHC